MTTYQVTGMTCDHCVRAVTEELSKLPGVTGVDVSLQTGEVVIAGEDQPDLSAVRAAIEEAGYQLAG